MGQGQSLQDQLLNSGLVNKKQARKAQQNKKSGKKKHQQKNAPPSEQDEIARDAAKAAEAKRAEDKAAAQKANAEREAREQRAAAEQLIDRHRIAREPAPEDDPPYSYSMGGRIRRLPISRNQRAQIANGKLAIVAREERVFLVERRIALRLMERIPERIYLIEDTSAEETDPDDPYAGYEVPDDLMW